MILEQWQQFVLVFVRVATVFALLPFLGQGRAPSAIKAMVALVLAFLIYPSQQVRLPVNSWLPLQYLLFVGAEVLFGIVMGLTASFVFSGVRMAGGIVGRQMGMALAITADPISGVEATPIGNFCELIAVVMLFALNGHHMMIRALHASFARWPLGAFLSAEFIRQIGVGAVAQGFWIAFQLAAPLLVLTFLVSVIMAVMARLVTEINVLIVGFPLRIGIGLVGLLLFVPVLVPYTAQVCRRMGEAMSAVAAGG